MNTVGKLYLFILSTLLIACNGSTNSTLSNPTSGEVSVSIDETLSQLMASQVDTFQSLYQKAKVNAVYKAEGDVFKDLITDSSDVVIVARTLNEKEKKFFEEKKLSPVITKIAIDAIALIINQENMDSLISLEQLQGILSGKISTWKQINKTSKLSDVQVVFDNNNSSTVRYITDSINGGKPLSKNCFATHSNDEVMNYVHSNKNAIGVIGVSWISDMDDPKTLSFLKNIRVVSLSGIQHTDMYYKPYQAYLQQQLYPLCRYVYMINREARNGLGTGFVSFVAGEKGQRIILKAGLVPATMPVRIVEFGNE